MSATEAIRKYEEFLGDIQQTGANSQENRNKLDLARVEKSKPKQATVGNAGYGERRDFLTHGLGKNSEFRDLGN